MNNNMNKSINDQAQSKLDQKLSNLEGMLRHEKKKKMDI
eukprot:CAMPEP_0170565504 /NCGR_PEP_ID=MMETSP0211-20121228/79230_1 /TAXON_ID=311385 /ORGANISM="Pseudokeronopsis sp., Strain OXSARD2" /LENGTH=38 /DNA_ID= /DNA_START= /DNA_END= /DNA_ORIENTATION=